MSYLVGSQTSKTAVGLSLLFLVIILHNLFCRKHFHRYSLSPGKETYWPLSYDKSSTPFNITMHNKRRGTLITWLACQLDTISYCADVAWEDTGGSQLTTSHFTTIWSYDSRHKWLCHSLHHSHMAVCTDCCGILWYVIMICNVFCQFLFFFCQFLANLHPSNCNTLVKLKFKVLR